MFPFLTAHITVQLASLKIKREWSFSMMHNSFKTHYPRCVSKIDRKARKRILTTSTKGCNMNEVCGTFSTVLGKGEEGRHYNRILYKTKET
jgi:hypothetical protein